MLYLASFILYAFQFMLGASLFSFLNVVVWRLPRHESICKGRSHCTTCNRQLTALELIPCFSYLFLRGHCKGCGEHISSRYFWVETLGGLLSVFSFSVYSSNMLQLVLVFGVFFILTVVAFIDWDTLEIYDRFPILLALCGSAAIWIFPEISWQSRLIGAFVISLPMFLLALLIPGAFGGGDIKLMAAMGLVLGWKATLIAGFIAIFLGGMYGIFLLVQKKAGRKDHFAFGPFLCIGSAVALVYGDAIANWYFSLIKF